MNENPRIRVARGTSDARVLLLLKMRRHVKIITINAMQTRTASSFATAEPTSYGSHEQ
jgi:hypothetical protein